MKFNAKRWLAGIIVTCGLLTGCATPPVPSPAPQASTTPALLHVTGTVTYLQRIALGPDAVVIVQLLDVSRMDAPATVLAEQRMTAPGQVPLPFDLPVDAARIDKRMRYTVAARILQGGKLAFISDTASPVLTQGSPARVELVLKMVP